jgi:murein DD-endopeptidase MepM/ murein hydrolase activator NlpD
VEHARSRSIRGLVVAVAIVGAAWSAVPSSDAQVPPVIDSSTTTTTTAPNETTTTGSQPSGEQLSSGSNKAPEGAQDAGGDGAAPPSSGIAVPPEAQRIIGSIKRTGPSDDSALLAMLPQLRALGMSEADAYRVGMGRFPIAGPAKYSHDWLFPRYGPGFRFHLGTDVFAAYGTPVRAPVDGVARTANGGLGGLTVKVVMPDGTYFYLAHLSGLVDGFVDGMSVTTGDIVGYVGDSGNARGGAPHLHIGIYPHGGPPIDPKPILDGFLAEAVARIPELVAALGASQPAAPTAGQPIPSATEQRTLRPMLATDVLHPLAAGGARMPAELLYLVGANPFAGPRALVDLALSDLVDDIDWSSRTP